MALLFGALELGADFTELRFFSSTSAQSRSSKTLICYEFRIIDD